MNALEMRNIELWLDRMMDSPEMAIDCAALARHAEKQRAEALAAALRSFWSGFVGFVTTVRQTAESCTAARLHHNHG